MSHTPMDNPVVKEEDEELAALGGKTRLVSRKSPTYSQPASPQGSSQPSVSPVEQNAPYVSPETPPSVAESTSPIIPEATWNGGYIPQADMYGYPYPTQDIGEWQPQPQSPPQPQPQHVHAHMPMQGITVDMGEVQYNGFEHAQAMPGTHHHQQYMHPQSPVHNQAHHMHPTDPHASWNYLFAQFNQV